MLRAGVDVGGDVGNHDAVGADGDIAAEGGIFVEIVVHDGLALGGVEHAGAEADQAAGGNGEFQVDLSGAVVHADEFTAAISDQFHRPAEVFLRHVDDEIFDGLEGIAVVVFFEDDVGLADGKFVTLAAHVLDEDAEMEQSAAGDFEGVLDGGFLELEGDVAFQFLEKAFAEVSAGDVFALLADEGGIVDAEHHGERRRFDFGGDQRLGVDRIADGIGDVDGLQADQGDDVTGVGFLDVPSAQAVENLDLLNLGLDAFAVAPDDGHLLAGADSAVEDPADADAPDVIVVQDAADLDLEGFVGIAMRSGDELQECFEDGKDVGPRLLEMPGGGAGAAAGVEDGEIEGFVIGAEFDKQVEDLVENLVGAGVLAVNLVDDHDGAQLVLESLFQDEAGLGHRSLGGIDEEEYAVGHSEDALDLAAEVSVAGGVDQVDLSGYTVGTGVIDGDVLGQDGDPPLALQGIGIEQGVLLDLAVAEIAALAKQGIDKRGLAMIDVGDDGDVANVVTHLIHSMTFNPKMDRPGPRTASKTRSPGGRGLERCGEGRILSRL